MSKSGAELIRGMYEEGKTITEMVERLEKAGRPRSYLSCLRVLKAAKVPLRGVVDCNRPWSSDEEAAIVKYVRSGATAEQMRKHLYRTAKSIREKLAELSTEKEGLEVAVSTNGFNEDFLILALSKPWG